ncbi:beta-hexosaminidase subunit alpha-like [Oppia nitens]|uniref:beta-hexosaminidase subunit alpha-like n=1 Tax=Oppia nitens TaxID=1686743 RepID=UPI0023DC6B91|nr:beta-hexosaminidase subunit alpha-like [Oppia nitens]
MNGPKLVPFPQQIVTYDTQLAIDSKDFKFITKTKNKCLVLGDAIKRYKDITFINDCNRLKSGSYSNKSYNNINYFKYFSTLHKLTNITIEMRGHCEDNQWPDMNMDEMYTIRIDDEDFPEQAFIFANTVWGALRALETFSQLIQHKYDNNFVVNSTFILDYPRFTYRGLLIDTSRHYLPKHVILENLDIMSYHKMNALHWHLIDDQSFPYVSLQFPELSAKGAYNPTTHVYTQKDIKEIVEFARVRGIRVIVEFDSPGHTLSLGKGKPYLLTACYSGDKPNGKLGPLNPSLNTTYDFLNTLFKEIVGIFPDQYLHLGGNEVDYRCWKSNPDIQTFMKVQRISGLYYKLEEYYFKRLFDIITNMNKTWIVWQQVFDKMIDLPNNTIVNVCKEDFNTELYELTKLNYKVILSSCWDLNIISYGYDWFQYYHCDPQAFNGSDHQNQLVIGGQASMWGEWVDGSNFITTTWPRTMAVAERLWSPKSMNNTTEAQYRFVRNRCRMLNRVSKCNPLLNQNNLNLDFVIVIMRFEINAIHYIKR